MPRAIAPLVTTTTSTPVRCSAATSSQIRATTDRRSSPESSATIDEPSLTTAMGMTFESLSKGPARTPRRRSRRRRPVRTRVPRAPRSRPSGAAAARRGPAPPRSRGRGGRSAGRPPRRMTRNVAVAGPLDLEARGRPPAGRPGTRRPRPRRRPPGAAPRPARAAAARARSSSSPWPVALTRSRRTGTPSRSRHSAAAASARPRAARGRPWTARGCAAARRAAGRARPARASITAKLARGSEPSSGARSSTCTSSRVRSTWARKSWPSPAPVAGALDQPGDVGDHELAVVGVERAEHRLERRERVGGDLRLRAGEPRRAARTCRRSAARRARRRPAA